MRRRKTEKNETVLILKKKKKGTKTPGFRKMCCKVCWAREWIQNFSNSKHPAAIFTTKFPSEHKQFFVSYYSLEIWNKNENEKLTEEGKQFFFLRSLNCVKISIWHAVSQNMSQTFFNYFCRSVLMKAIL